MSKYADGDGTEDEDLASDLEWDAHWAAFDDEE
jgi:hypothetical protein